MTLPVLVAALGYFIDVYDIWIFGANRVASLTDIGVAPEDMLDTGVLLLNLQMAGLFLGGLFFGVLGDKYGRTKMMFVSILTYSMATLLNGLVHSVEAYAVFRFVAGFGLAGELGLAVTLISESLPKEKRGYGTGIIVGFGVFGALAAALLAHIVPWRVSFIIGGLAGLALLIFRIKVHESTLFEGAKNAAARGSMRLIINNRQRFLKFMYCVFMVLPIWFASAVLVTFGPELISAQYGYAIAAASLMVWFNLFLALSDFASAWISQWVRSRKKVLFCFILLGFVMTAALLLSPVPLTLPVIIALYIGVAIGGGCWVLGITTAAESFGTNLRATVTTMVPNFSRAATIPMTLGLAALKEHMSLGHATMVIGAVIFALALLGSLLIPETHSKNLDYVEE
jgi:putative MFS transporter